MRVHLRSLVWSFSAAWILFASSGCCCFWHNVHGAMHCGQGHGCGQGVCETSCAAPSDCGGCGGSCGGGCGHGGRGFTLLGWLFGNGCNSHGCNILGCGSHYLDPQGACYGEYCGSCCESSGCNGCHHSGCGDMYWGDYFNVPPTTDPCDCCQNYVGPYWGLGGSTPSYYGPAPHYQHAPHSAVGAVPTPAEGVIVAEKTTIKSTAPSKVTSAPGSAPAKVTSVPKTGTPTKAVK